MDDGIRLETDTAPGVATVRLDRPKVNALTPAMLEALAECGAELAARSDIRAVLIWGGPEVFAAGADIAHFAGLDQAGARARSKLFHAAMDAIAALPQVTIAAVHGYALGGGCELALATDLRLAAEDATFGLPEVQLGLIPGGGGTQRLPRLIGAGPAKEMILTGRHVPAREAHHLGLVTEVHPAAELHDAAVTWAERMAAGPVALRLALAAIDAGAEVPLAEALDIEADRFGECFATEDHRIGLASFAERGPGRAEFVGR